MKLFTATLIVLLLCAVSPKAQESVAFGGGYYDNSAGFGMLYGVSTYVGEGIWFIPRFSVGGTASFEPDLGYFVNHKNWRLGLIAAPNVEWVGGEDFVTYITGASGIVGGYLDGEDGFGLLGSAKYKFAWDEDNLYKDGWEVGVYLAKGF